jgi:hypothetical protein
VPPGKYYVRLELFDAEGVTRLAFVNTKPFNVVD